MKFVLLIMSITLISCSHHGGRYLKKFDTNGDSKISKSEWDQGHSEKFSKKDKNGDGFLTEEEIGKFHCKKSQKGASCPYSSKKTKSKCSGKSHSDCKKQCEGKDGSCPLKNKDS
ncbi:MAG: hypothetical protein HOE90_03665 [Bacteriovoracaceae bacterium]|nr:hypothetical protein [Bacteriovoracaceae bacterium]